MKFVSFAGVFTLGRVLVVAACVVAHGWRISILGAGANRREERSERFAREQRQLGQSTPSPTHPQHPGGSGSATDRRLRTLPAGHRSAFPSANSLSKCVATKKRPLPRATARLAAHSTRLTNLAALCRFRRVAGLVAPFLSRRLVEELVILAQPPLPPTPPLTATTGAVTSALLAARYVLSLLSLLSLRCFPSFPPPESSPCERMSV